MGKKIDAFVDCASPYSFFAVVYLRRQRKALEQYGVEIEFHPFFLGGVMQATGNKPPGSLPAKAKYGPQDLKRTSTHFAVPAMSIPSFFPIFSVLPQRVMLAIKTTYPREKFESVYETLWLAVFNRHINIGKAEELVKVLSESFGEDEVKKLMGMAGEKGVKDLLTENTKRAVDLGSFGAPWFWLTDEKGEGSAVFGSDRWSYIFRILGVEVRELEIVENGPKL